MRAAVAVTVMYVLLFVLHVCAFVSSSASHPACPHGQHAQKRELGPPLLGAGRFDTICTAA